MAGCCYGSACSKPWAITFTNPEAWRFSQTPLGLPLHPVQLYTFAGNLAVMGLLLALRPKRRFEGQVLAAYFVLEGIARAVVEAWRGDGDRGIWLGLSWLSTGRLTALLFVAIGLVLAAVLSRRTTAKAA
jgi:phosphatidylglycerol:prolipoprotein diacylglycerol transferase